MKIFNFYRQHAGRDLNPRSPEYEAGA